MCSTSLVMLTPRCMRHEKLEIVHTFAKRSTNAAKTWKKRTQLGYSGSLGQEGKLTYHKTAKCGHIKVGSFLHKSNPPFPNSTERDPNVVDAALKTVRGRIENNHCEVKTEVLQLLFHSNPNKPRQKVKPAKFQCFRGWSASFRPR